ncbi:MAG: hypothetical protein J2P26_01545 [Nocardiopsaceae bacterium]|nr:hypothetical protein [Nocardiopsaceae bacterium]
MAVSVPGTTSVVWNSPADIEYTSPALIICRWCGTQRTSREVGRSSSTSP